MAKYIKQEFKSIRGEGEASAFYRMETSRKVTMDEFVGKISAPGYGISEGTAKQVSVRQPPHWQALWQMAVR